MAKGGNFEREISKALSLWWTNGKREDVFYRSQASGGRFTMRRKTGKDTALQGGDITASDSIGEPLIKQWSIECKTGYGKKTDKGISRWDVLDLIDSQQKETVLEKMWAQCRRDALLTKREPILIFRRNGRKPCVMLNFRYFLMVDADLFFHKKQIQMIDDNTGMVVVILAFNLFLDNVSPNTIRKPILKKRI